MLRIVAMLIAVSSTAYAKEVGFDPINGEPIHRLEDLPTHAPDRQPMIYNGTRSVAGEFGPMGWIGNCTGTLVADNVIVTAAHCTRTGAQITYTNRETGRAVRAVCTIHPRYNTRTVYNDYAFCKLSESLPSAQKVTLELSPGVVAGERMLMNGFGAPNVRVHHWGSGNVRSINGQDIVTCGPSNLGGGDSGGVLLKWSSERGKSARFVAVGINSRGGGGCDYYNRLNHSEFTSWVREYETAQGVRICGVGRSDCGPTPPSPTPIPSDCEGVKAHLEKLGKCVIRGAGREECEAALSATDKCRKAVIQ